MARLIRPVPFDPNRPVVVRKAFTGSGRHYRPGDPFDWKRLSVDQRRVRNMYDANMLCHSDGAAAEAKPEPKPVAVPAAHVPAAPVVDTPEVTKGDYLDDIDDMKELRSLADAIGAPYKVSKVDQRQAIRDKRAEQ